RPPRSPPFPYTTLFRSLGIPFEEMLHTVEIALAAAYKRAFTPEGEVVVELDTKTGALDVRSRIVRHDGTMEVRELPAEEFKRMADRKSTRLNSSHLGIS